MFEGKDADPKSPEAVPATVEDDFGLRTKPSGIAADRRPEG